MGYRLIIPIVLSLIISGCGNSGVRNQTLKPATKPNKIAEANLNLGIAYLQRGDYEVALRKLEKARKADPKYAPIFNTLGVLYQKLGDNKTAERHYRKALKIDPVNSPTLNNYGQFLCQTERYEKAEEAFLKATENPLYETPENPLNNAGNCAMQQGLNSLAEKYFRQALAINPEIPSALIQMAYISYNGRRYLSARGYFQRYIEIKPHTAESLWLGIRIERELGDKNAVSSYSLLLKNQFPDSEETKELMETNSIIEQ